MKNRNEAWAVSTRQTRMTHRGGFPQTFGQIWETGIELLNTFCWVAPEPRNLPQSVRRWSQSNDLNLISQCELPSNNLLDVSVLSDPGAAVSWPVRKKEDLKTESVWIKTPEPYRSFCILVMKRQRAQDAALQPFTYLHTYSERLKTLYCFHFCPIFVPFHFFNHFPENLFILLQSKNKCVLTGVACTASKGP